MDDCWNLPAMWLLDVRDGCVLRASFGYTRRFSSKSPLARRWTEVLEIDDPASANVWLNAAGACPVYIANAERGTRWWRLTAYARGASESAGGKVIHIEDVTVEHAAIERMRREGAHFHALIERSAEGISVFDTQAKILYESPSNKRIHGYDAAEMEGRNLFDFCHPEDMARVMPRFVHLAEGPGVVETDIVRFRHKDGHYIYLEGTVLNATDDPRVGGLVNNFRDVTGRIEVERELRRSKEAAEQAQRLQQHFLANLSHEFKTPLTLIRGPLADLSQERIAPESRSLAWSLVERNVARLDSLLTELIDLARLESGTLVLRANQHDLVAFVQGQIDWIAELTASRHITVRLDAPTECAVFFDATKLEKVIGNLLGNAVKFSPDNTTIRVGIQRVGLVDNARADAVACRVHVSVTDQGPGMDEATRARVFERFFQGDAGLARGHEGMGIGLAIAREMVEMHGGAMDVESTPGAGSTFSFWLPLGCDHLDLDDIDTSALPEPRMPLVNFTPIAPYEEEVADTGAPRPRLLLVEDNFDMRAYLRMQLDPHYVVREALNGQDALASLDQDTPDIILSDVMMPQLDGLELCRRLKADPRFRGVPLVLLSAKGSADHRVEGLKAGADDYLAKPFSMSELLQRLRARLPAASLRVAAEFAAPDRPDRAGEWIDKLIACIDENLAGADCDVELLARQMGYSSRQLQRRVLALHGMTPAALLLKRRMIRARELIATRRYETIAQIAHAVGLSPGYFSRRYRREYGCAEIPL